MARIGWLTAGRIHVHDVVRRRQAIASELNAPSANGGPPAGIKTPLVDEEVAPISVDLASHAPSSILGVHPPSERQSERRLVSRRLSSSLAPTNRNLTRESHSSSISIPRSRCPRAPPAARAPIALPARAACRACDETAPNGGVRRRRLRTLVATLGVAVRVRRIATPPNRDPAEK